MVRFPLPPQTPPRSSPPLTRTATGRRGPSGPSARSPVAVARSGGIEPATLRLPLATGRTARVTRRRGDSATLCPVKVRGEAEGVFETHTHLYTHTHTRKNTYTHRISCWILTSCQPPRTHIFSLSLCLSLSLSLTHTHTHPPPPTHTHTELVVGF